jgi:hypothetical protein
VLQPKFAKNMFQKIFKDFQTQELFLEILFEGKKG